MGRRRQPASQTWRTFLRNHIGQIVAADFFVVPTVTYRLLFILVLLAHDRRRIRHIAVTAHPTAAWTAQQLRAAFPWDEAPRYLLHDRDHAFDRLGAMGIEEVQCIRRAIHWIRTSRVSRPCDRVQRSGPAAPDDPLLFVLRTVPHAFIAGQRHADSSSRHVAGRWCCRRRDPGSRWLASSLRTAHGLNTGRRCRLGAHGRRTPTATHDAAAVPARRRPISSPFSTSRAATSASFRHNELTARRTFSSQDECANLEAD
jgi:hypothetical protein